ncbi:transmembrane protein 235 isoform 2-T2 [Salvelinus alpinus]
MKLSFSYLVITAGIFGILSFAFLATAIGSDYWYIIKVNRTNRTDTDVSDSHSGLWITYEGQKVYSYTFNSPNYSEPEMHMLNMHSAIVVLLPLSLVLLVFGGICGLISSLARSPALLTGTASYLILCILTPLPALTLSLPAVLYLTGSALDYRPLPALDLSSACPVLLINICDLNCASGSYPEL